MWWTAIIAGLSLGAASSLHCVGMCGPLALALPVHHLSRTKQLIALFLFQLGRVFTYSCFGLLFGLAGRRIYIAGFQQWFSIVMGSFILLLIVLYWFFKNPLQPSVFRKVYSAVQSYMIKAFRSRQGSAGFIVLGMANGLLPCGMVYVAVAAAVTTTEVSHSVLFMAMFGAGTMPAMMIIGFFGRMASLRVRNIFRNSIPVFMAVMAIVLILRGLNLGIPFISPELQGPTGKTVVCH